MNLIIWISVIVVLGFIFGRMIIRLSQNNLTKASSITMIDKKHWIVNGEYIDLEEDTPVNRMKQRHEDDKHYWDYESNRLTRDRQRIGANYFKTIKAINNKDFSYIKECVTPENLKEITEKYDKHVNMCKKLEEDFILTKEEFLIKENNPMHCVDFTASLDYINTTPMIVYNIYNDKTARYKNGNKQKMMEVEFKEKWY